MFLYNLVVIMYGFVIRIASMNNSKAKLWVSGRKNWRITLEEKISKINNEKKIWVHCASLGEFEQGRPLIEAIRKKHPQYKIVLTFFSPSGFEASKNYAHAEVISYLPLDTKQNARDFMSIVKPHMAIFIKYEFWINFLNALKSSKTPSYLVSAVFKDHHPFFKWYGKIFVRSLEAFKTLFVQEKHSKELLHKIGYTNVEICGDTRFDRVLEIKENFVSIPELEKFKGSAKLILGGSTWPGDEDLMIESFKRLSDPSLKLVLAPHEIKKSSIDGLKQNLERNGLKYCLFTEGIKSDCNVLILNTIGLLSRSYSYANMAYVGGGFNDGIHNILEPAVYFIPVAFFGANYHKFNEAVDLVKLQAAFCVSNAEELHQHWKKVLDNSIENERISHVLQGYFASNGNVTSKVMTAIDFS
ncbi:MAG: 3-deoxy-D-manno-octulosonic acid transferase [Sphingobacteriaceae bacterium]|nr:3-deoxy-D-manno-octulosonic acid transferase [Sphingobacteriaceae bacterium]